jgi:hypothetical protein
MNVDSIEALRLKLAALLVPGLEDWHSEPWCLDAKAAFEHFHGKTIAEAVRLFEDNSLYYQEDVMFMPSRVFGYYLFAYAMYLLSDAAADDLDGASCFIVLIDHKARMQQADIVPIWNDVRQILEHLAANYGFYGASPEIYGSFRARCETIVRLLDGVRQIVD